ncbi:MAG: sigma-54-dependent transcriptional regulator [Planktomarina sp.]
MIHRVLIIDDDRQIRTSLVDLVEAAGWTAKALSRANDADRWIAQFQPDVILSDVRMPDMTGLDLLHSLVVAPPVVLISAHGDIPTAVEAMNGGAYSFVEKPFDPKRLLLILSHAAQQHHMQESNQRLKARLQQLTGLDRVILGQTSGMVKLRETIAMMAQTSTPILIHGETGTGKSLAAQALHDASGRCDGPFVVINLAQMNAAQLPLIAQSASGGTLLLDEICTCPVDLQPALLRLIDAQEILPKDSGMPETVDLKIISTTNADTTKAVTQGRLRQDLLFRLEGFVISLPTLKARLGDIGLLIHHFIDRAATIQKITAPTLTDADHASLIAHNWPGNLRELRNVADRFVMLSQQGRGTIAAALSGDDKGNNQYQGLREAVAAFERQMISKAIQTHHGRMEHVAETLRIGRRTLNEKIVKLGVDKDALL